MPGYSALLDADAPVFTILATTAEYLQPSGKKKEAIYGKSIFEAFPVSPDQDNQEAASNLARSFTKVIETGKPDIMPEQRYDITNPDGVYSEYYWQATNTPVFDDDGKVIYIIHTAADITKMVTAGIKEDSLKRYEPAYNLFMQAPVAIAIIKGSDMYIEMANDTMKHVWGKGSMVTGRKMREVLPELEDQGFFKIINDVRSSGNPYYAFEEPVMLVRGGVNCETYFTFFYQPYYEDRNSEPAGIMIFANEVTEKVLASKQVQEREDRYKQMLFYRKALLEAHNAASLDGILLVDTEGKILSWNQRFVEIWDIPVEILEDGDDRVALNIAKSKFKDPEQFIQKVYSVYEHPEEPTVDILEFSNGQILERQGYPVIGEDGTYYAWSWTFRDITETKTIEKELRESETRYRELSQSLENLVEERTFKLSQLNETYQYAEEIGKFGSYRYTFATQQLTYSDNLYRLLGCKPQEFPSCPEAFIKFIHPEDRDYVEMATQHAFHHEKVEKWEYRIVRKNGEMIYVRGTGSIINGENGEKYMIGTLQDINDEKEHERQLKEKNAALQTMNKELESFAYISSHDLQEPLRKIQTFASRVIESEFDKLSESGRSYFEKMQNAALRMQTLIDDLLAYSRTSAEDKNFEIINLAEIVAEIQEELSEEISVYHADIVLENMEDVKIIPFQFKQIMHNLIGNALKFSRREELPRIVISSKNAPGEEFEGVKLPSNLMFCQITIADNGIGFGEEYREKIFEVFQRLHGRDKYNGTGIGLAIVKKIVDNHEGMITAEGIPGKGATFNIYIPSA